MKQLNLVSVVSSGERERGEREHLNHSTKSREGREWECELVSSDRDYKSDYGWKEEATKEGKETRGRENLRLRQNSKCCLVFIITLFLSLSFSLSLSVFLSLSSAPNSSSSFLLHRCISPSLTQLLFTLLLFGYFFSPSLSSLSCLFFVFVTNLHFSPSQTQLIFFYFPFFFPFLSLLKQIVFFILFSPNSSECDPSLSQPISSSFLSMDSSHKDEGKNSLLFLTTLIISKYQFLGLEPISMKYVHLDPIQGEWKEESRFWICLKSGREGEKNQPNGKRLIQFQHVCWHFLILPISIDKNPGKGRKKSKSWKERMNRVEDESGKPLVWKRIEGGWNEGERT